LKRFLEKDVLPDPEVNLKICENLSGLSAAYPAPEGSAAIVGRRLANLTASNASSGGASVFELLRGQEFVLLDLSGEVSLPHVEPGVRVVTAIAEPGERPLLAGLNTILLRPDGHVAWASAEKLDAYLPEREIREWLGMHENAPVFGQAAAVQAA
jgi:hypothetical protein